MAVAIRYMIQKEVFGADDRVLVIVSVTKPGRKKKPSFLVISVNKNEGAVELSRVKSLERKEIGKESYKRVKTWSISELRSVDGHGVESLEFELIFEKQSFKWIANNVSDKNTFITQLYKVVHSSGSKKTQFINVDDSKLNDVLSARDSSVNSQLSVSQLGDVGHIQQQEEWQEISYNEEKAIESLLGRDNAIQDAASFMEHLSEELSQLDQGNIHALMGSENQIQDLMGRLEQGVLEIERMEMKINVYDELLSTVREAMSKLGVQYSTILLQSNNLRSLFNEVDQLVEGLDLDPRVEEVLRNPQLHNPNDIRDCELAAESLQASLEQLSNVPHGVEVLQAVNEQSELFTDLSSAFGHQLQSHITKLFTLNSSVLLDNTLVRHTSGPTIASHSQTHSDLLSYSGLMNWLKECEPLRFSEVVESYVRCFKPVYQEEIKILFTDSKMVLGRSGDHNNRRTGFLGRAGSNLDMLSSLKPSNPLSSSLMVLSPTRADRMTQSVADFTTGLTADHRPRFDQVFSTLLEQIQPVCVSEQKFMTSFFHFAKPHKSQSIEDVSTEDDIDGSLMAISQSNDVIGLLEQLFSILLPEIESFIAHGDKIDSYNALHLLVAVSQRLMFALESGSTSFLDDTLKKALLYIKRLFDKLIVTKRRQFEDMKVPRGSKCGVLPCVVWFKEFAEKAEAIVMGTDRRADLDKAYQTLIDAVFKSIERVAIEHQKTPPDVIKFENYRSLVDMLSRLKIAFLESKRDIAKKKYRSHKIDYVKNCLGRPLDKLSAFFEGVESLRASGTKAEEVGYRLDYSRNELKKCIKEYPGKEVKRGLDKLYRRVEKEVSDSDLQVVWGAMQEAFIEQAQRFESLISECYPGANISLEFTVDNLAEYFATISAQK